MDSDLIIKKSGIPGAGKGLFTKVAIKKGTRVVEYLGEVITEAELDKRAENDIYGYAFYISKKKCVDAYYTPKELARWANDAKGLTKIKGITNNCCYVVYKNAGWIKAEKDIPAGAEILVAYGAEYWKEIRENLGLDKKKTKTKKTKTKSKKKKK